jgi:hypothetical protein
MLVVVNDKNYSSSLDDILILFGDEEVYDIIEQIINFHKIDVGPNRKNITKETILNEENK